jgi:hypothetical protein
MAEVLAGSEDADKNVRGRQECLPHQEECRLESLHHKDKNQLYAASA